MLKERFIADQAVYTVHGLRQLPWTPDYGTSMLRQLGYLGRYVKDRSLHGNTSSVERMHSLVNVLYHQGSPEMKSVIIRLFVLPLYEAMLRADGNSNDMQSISPSTI